MVFQPVFDIPCVKAEKLERAGDQLAVRHHNERQTGVLGGQAEHFLSLIHISLRREGVKAAAAKQLTDGFQIGAAMVGECGIAVIDDAAARCHIEQPPRPAVRNRLAVLVIVERQAGHAQADVYKRQLQSFAKLTEVGK